MASSTKTTTSASPESAAGPTPPRKPRRQWGAERRSEPLSILHPAPSRLKLTMGRLAILATILSWAMYVVTTIIRELLNNPELGFRFAIEAVSYLIVVTFLTFSALMHLLARQGAMYRFRDHRRVARAVLDRHFDEGYDKGVTVLVPSYVEELSVVRKTLWSAALQEFPSIRLVLLLDDPPNPSDPQRLAELTATRAMPAEIEAELEPPKLRLVAAREGALAAIEDRGARVVDTDIRALAEEYRFAADWLERFAADWPVEDHTDEFFVERVIMGLCSELRLTLLALDAAVEQDGELNLARIRQLYSRLVWIFDAQLTSFERKQYASLSHEANKAMNLNSYISLIGHDWHAEHTADGVVLRHPEEGESVELSVPGTEYLLTLDADSMLLRDYCIRLVEFLEEPGNERVAVTQTPYSSYRGAPTRIERIAGATTDVQHILHQGLSYYDATFWVGANAVIRRQALEDISRVETVAGFEIKSYIQDRTVIEDTESSIDIGAKGWSLVNYPERLSYSSTPPDFGSLIVQRRRWANGGLLILPKLWSFNSERRRQRQKVFFRGTLLRVNYMASITWATFGLLFLLAYPYDGRLLSPWVFLAAVPYFLAYGSDMRESGHRFSDIFRIYGFNLVLLAVNMAGVLKSLQQSLTGEKIPFVRTPKVQNRTSAPGLYVLIPYLIVAFSLLTFWRDINAGNWGNAAFAALNTVLCSWAIVAYIGIKNSVVDMVLGVVNWLFVDKKPKQQKVQQRTEGPTDWQSILYYGDRRLARDLHGSKDRRRRIYKG